MTAPVAGVVAKKVAQKEVQSTVEKKVAQKAVTSKKPVTTTSSNKVKKASFQKRAMQNAGKGKKRVMPRLPPAKQTVRYRQVIAAEIIIGSIIILTKDNNDDPNTDFANTIKQEAAFLIVFFVLSILTVGGPSSSRFASTFGGLIVLGLMVTNPNFISKVSPQDGIATFNPFGKQPLPVNPAPGQIPGMGDLPLIPGTSYSGGGGIQNA